MNIQRLLCLLLAGLLLAAPLTACNGGDGTETESGSVSESVSDSESDTEIETAPDTPNPVDLLRIGGVAIDQFTVVYPSDMPEGQKAALDLFVAEIARATGVTLPTVPMDPSAASPDEVAVEPVAEHMIVIGQNVRENAKVAAAVAEIKNDGYALVVDEGDLYITASTGRGVAYGIYDFLEKYVGVRFYADDYVIVKEKNIIDIPADLKDVFSPVFSLRGGAVWMTQSPAFYRFNQGNMATYGDDIHINTYSGHEFANIYHGNGGHGVEPLPCLTDETVYATVRDNLFAMIEKHTVTPDSIAMGQSDGVGACTCDNCKAVNEQQGCEGGAYFAFINRLAAELGETYPETKIIIYSYQFTHTPPKDLEFNDHVIVNFCMDNACFYHAFTDPACEKNVKVMAELTDWTKVTRQIVLYDYINNCSNRMGLDPNLFVRLSNFRAMADLGLSGHGVQWMSVPAGEFEELHYYLVRHLQWNPYMTEEEYNALIDEFMTDYYGGAASYMMEYIKRTTENSGTSGFISDVFGMTPYSGCTAMYLPQQVFFKAYNEDGSKNTTFTLEMWDLWEDALKADNMTDAQRDHVERSSMHFYAWCLSFLNSKTEKREANERFRAAVEKFGFDPSTW